MQGLYHTWLLVHHLVLKVLSNWFLKAYKATGQNIKKNMQTSGATQ